MKHTQLICIAIGLATRCSDGIAFNLIQDGKLDNEENQKMSSKNFHGTDTFYNDIQIE